MPWTDLAQARNCCHLFRSLVLHIIPHCHWAFVDRALGFPTMACCSLRYNTPWPLVRVLSRSTSGNLATWYKVFQQYSRQQTARRPPIQPRVTRTLLVLGVSNPVFSKDDVAPNEGGFCRPDAYDSKVPIKYCCAAELAKHFRITQSSLFQA